MAEEKHNVYIIPDNFIEGGRIFNGLLKTRNLIEACIFGLLIGLPLYSIQFPSIEVKIIVLIACVGPVFFTALIGINDSSLVELLLNIAKWRRNKRVMLYNNKVKPRQVRAADVIEAQVLPKDKLIDMIDSHKEKKRMKNANMVLIEGEDFEFVDNEPSSAYVEAENKVLGIEKPKKDSKKNKNKSKKQKEKKLLTEPSSSKSDKEDILIDNEFFIDNDTEIEIIQEGEE